MWKSKISPPKHGKSWKKMSKVFLSTVGHWLEPTWRAVFCNTSDTPPTYSLLQVSLRTWGRTVSSILKRKNFETEISFMCNVGFVSGGLQPLHYKQLLALYTDVTSLGHAEDEVRNVLFPRLMCPQVKRLCQPIFSEGPGPPFEDIYWLAVQVSFLWSKNL